ncbi:hypothetical protein [Brevibacillus borstelensis]|uniref:hypothetical protein n=1 Tax=Brevibacillus borstelensis TaxID=45462 RepID=UPI00046935FE|nr:hypothetical protein [Brevibacillus borstelensis]
MSKDILQRYDDMSVRAAMGDVKAQIATHIFDALMAELITDDQALEIVNIWRRDGIFVAYELFLQLSGESHREEVTPTDECNREQLLTR